MYCEECGQVMLLWDDEYPGLKDSWVCADCDCFAPRRAEPADADEPVLADAA
jgi:hypothetical protein